MVAPVLVSLPRGGQFSVFYYSDWQVLEQGVGEDVQWYNMREG